MSVNLNDCVWVSTERMDCTQPMFGNLRRELDKRGIKRLTIRDGAPLVTFAETLSKIKQHVVLDGLMPNELRFLRPLFKSRGNFSVALVDWWASDYWFTRNAEHVLFRNYNGIVLRNNGGRFCWKNPPLFNAIRQGSPKFEVTSALLRPFALAVSPAVQVWKCMQQLTENVEPKRLVYFPFSVDAQELQLKRSPKRYFYCNVSSTEGYWLMRDPYAPAHLSFANLYDDRQRLADRLLKRGWDVFDIRKSGRLDWEDYCEVIRSSNFALVSGGLHGASVAKFVETTCLGTPMLGKELLYEYPWLTDCIYNLDYDSDYYFDKAIRCAFDWRPQMERACLNVRDHLLRLYSPATVLDMAQEQIDGKPVRKGYLK